MITEENVKVWLDSGDPMLQFIGENLIGLEIPPEKELTEILTFFNIAAIGCKEMKLEEEALKFKKRADFFNIGLRKLGLSNKSRYEYVLNRIVPGPIQRIIRRASSKAAHIMCDLVRIYPIKNGKWHLS